VNQKNTRKVRAGDPVTDGKLPHLKISLEEKLPQVFFLPGDPARIAMFEDGAEDFTAISSNREFAVARGIYKGIPFGVCSTGIGGGSTEICLVELARLGVRVMIRTGGCGALLPGIACGGFIINSGAVRWGGSSFCYVPPEFPAVSDPFLTVILAQTCRRLGFAAHVGIGATIGSYYEGQGRVSLPGREPLWGKERMRLLQDAGVLNIDMETETLFSIGYVLKVKTANILAVHGNRATDEWLSDYERAQKNLVRAALESLEEINAYIMK
jgi:uridine phosphorylase